MNVPTRFDRGSLPLPSTPLKKRRAFGFIGSALNVFKALREPDNHELPALQCCGSPPRTLSEHCSPNLDRILNVGVPEDGGFSEICDDEICPIDHEYESNDDESLRYAFDEETYVEVGRDSEDRKCHSSNCSFPDIPCRCRPAPDIVSKGFRRTRVVPKPISAPLRARAGGAVEGIGRENTEKDTPKDHSTPKGKNQASLITAKRPIFQPPPPDDEIDSDEGDESDSDEWSIIDMNHEDELSKDTDCSDKPRRELQKAEGIPDYGTDETQSPHPRIHPLFAFKYGEFFEQQPKYSRQTTPLRERITAHSMA